MGNVPAAALRWITGGDTGLSSKRIWAQMVGTKPDDYWDRTAHPWDPADLGRCIRLLDAVPEWRQRLPEMAGVSREWAGLVAAWDELERLYRKEEPTGRAPRCYARMEEILEAARRKEAKTP